MAPPEAVSPETCFWIDLRSDLLTNNSRILIWMIYKIFCFCYVFVCGANGFCRESRLSIGRDASLCPAVEGCAFPVDVCA